MNKKEEYEEKVKSMGFDSVADYRRYLMYASDEEFMKYVSANVCKDAVKGSEEIRNSFLDSMNLTKDADAIQRFRSWSSGHGKSATIGEKCCELLVKYFSDNVADDVASKKLDVTTEELCSCLQAIVNQYGECHDVVDLFWYTMKCVGRMFKGEPIETRDVVRLLHEESLVNKRPVESIAKFEQVGREQLSKIGCVEEQEIKLPERATVGSAGYDFFAPKDYMVAEGETVVIPTGVRCCMEPGWVLSLYPRSGMGFKYLVGLANTVGIIDSDYYYSDNEGHIMVKLVNRGSEPLEIKKGKAFCQGIFTKYGVTIDDNAKDIRNGGFNSTNK